MFKKLGYILIGSIVTLGLIASNTAFAAVLQGFQGGTGFGTSTPGNDNLCLIQSSSSPFLTWRLGTCGAGSATTSINQVFGPTFTIIISTSAKAATWTVTSTTSTNQLNWTFTIPPANDQYFAPSTTIPTNNNQLTNGAAYTTYGSSGPWTANPFLITNTLNVSGTLQANGGMTGTSTLAWGGNANVSGTLKILGVPVLTTSSVSINGTAGNVFTGLSTSTPANPTASIGTAAVNGTANTFMRSDAAPKLSTQFASYTVPFGWYNATTTAPYSRYGPFLLEFASTVARVECAETAAATTTVSIYLVPSITSTEASITTTTLRSIQCGINGTSTNTFNTTVVPAGSYWMAVVSSTAQTPTYTHGYMTLSKN